MMVGTMKPLLPRLINFEQDAFVGGRNIANNILIAQKLMHDLQCALGLRNLMVVKLDTKRAYDRVC